MWHRWSTYGILRWALGLLLLAAAALKAHQLATQPVAGESLFTSRAFLTVWVEAEILLGLLLVSGLLPHLTWLAATACFVAFAGATLVKALAGEASCGCFGVVEINPWYTFILDVTALALLAIFHPNFRLPLPVTHPRFRLVAVIAAALAAGIPAALAAALYQPATIAEDGGIIGDARFVVLEPETWEGKLFPLMRHTDVADKLASGRWTVVLYHHDCPHCQERLPEFERQAREEGRLRGFSSMAMLELPPYAPAGKSLVPADTSCLTGRVSDTRDWFVETPTVVMLKDGTVVSGSETEPVVSAPNVAQSIAAGSSAPRMTEVLAPQVVAAAPPAPPSVQNVAEAAPPARLAAAQPPTSPIKPAALPQSSSAPVRPAEPQKAVPVTTAEYYFGFVEPKSTVTATVELENHSQKPLVIKAVRSECKCMTGTVAEKTIAPGNPLNLEVALNVPDKPMYYSERILVQTNDPAQPPLIVRVRADVGMALAAEPSPLDLGTAAPGERREGTVIIRNRGQTPAGLIYSTSSNAGCFAKVPRDPVPPLGTINLPVVVTAGTVGPQNVTIQISTDLAAQPALSVPVKLVVGKSGASARANMPEGVLLSVTASEHAEDHVEQSR